MPSEPLFEYQAVSALSRSVPSARSRADSFMITLRRILKGSGLLPLIKSLRAILVLGPWRALPRYLIRIARPVARSGDERKSLLQMPADPEAIAREIHLRSISVQGLLPADTLTRLRGIADRMPIGEFKDMHRVDDDVRRLSEDPAVISVLRCYFRCEPELIGATLDISSHEKYRSRGLSQFHIDYPGWESLNLFVYLSDVTRQKSYHVLATGSHRQLGFRDMVRRKISDEEAQRRFGSRLQAVTGPAGTIFFENTEAFHKRRPGRDKHRALLKLTYTSHRGLFSQGRTSPEELARTANLVQSAREEALADAAPRSTEAFTPLSP